MERSPCEEVTHIHKHVIKGWTTNPRANDAFGRTSQRSLDTPVGAEHKRGELSTPQDEANHIHRHVIKGWTTNPHANDSYRPVSRCGQREDQEEVTDELSDSSPAEYTLRVTVLPDDGSETETEERTGKWFVFALS